MNKPSQRPQGTKVFTLLSLAAVALSVSACGGGSSDVSPEGQIDYACALIDDVKEKRTAPDDWGTPIGDDADPAIIQAASAAALAGAMTGGGSESSEIGRASCREGV